MPFDPARIADGLVGNPFAVAGFISYVQRPLVATDTAANAAIGSWFEAATPLRQLRSLGTVANQGPLPRLLAYDALVCAAKDPDDWTRFED